MSGLKILSITPNATIQDRGRAGLLRYGVTSSGAMDLYALAEGQALLGNHGDDAAIEFAYSGGRFEALSAVSVALSGAEMLVTLNAVPIKWRQVIDLRVGDFLEIGAAVDGVYGYLHVAGGFQTERVLGSRATYLRAGFGHVLAAGQVLAIGDGGRIVDRVGLARPDYFNRRVLRILWGPQSQLFAADLRQKFLQTRFQISPARDRMGIQIVPQTPLEFASSGLSVASDATSPGDIQITGNGTPAVLLADRGPTGGYPRIATLAHVDMAALAQTATGADIKFELIDRAQGVALLKDYQRQIKGLASNARRLIRDPRDIADLLAYNLIGGVTAGRGEDEN